MMKSRIAVVGAGLAGATATRELLRAGHDVSVFEKSRGVGGRMATRRSDDDAFDHGAQYFTAKGEAFAAQVRDWCGRELAARWEARIVHLSMGRVAEEPSGLPRYVGFPKMSVLARDLLDGATLSCAERVENLERTSSGWSLYAEDSRELGNFDIVVFAAPAAQTEILLRQGAGLPETIALADRIRGVSVDPCHAVMVRFAESLDQRFDAAFVDDPALAWIARGGSKPGRPGATLAAESWLLHSTPEWSLAHVEDDPDSVGQAQLTALAKQLGGGLPEVTAVATHRWLYSRTRTPLGGDAIWDSAASIGLCGDWLRGARIEDAFESGRAVATAICRES